MVKIRLKRIGNKFNAIYRIVVADAKAPRDGKFIEEIGFYNPHSKELKIEKDLAFKWLTNGAQLTDTAKDLFTKEKLIAEFNKQKPQKKVKKAKSRKVKSKTKEAKANKAKTVKKQPKKESSKAKKEVK